MKQLKKQFEELLNIYGVSGEETEVRSYVKPILEEMMDKVEIDAYGNLLAEKKCGKGEGSTVLLSAHMDTVSNVSKDKKVVEEDGIYTAILPSGQRGTLGGDDRCGIAIILSVLRNIPNSFNGTIKVAFSREEEIGCRGAEKIPVYFLEGVDLAIVCDRRGSRDIVVGCFNAFCCNEVGYFMEDASAIANMDWRCVEGGISDACVFSQLGINAINLSVGFKNEHTSNEYANIYHMRDTTILICQALALINQFSKTFTSVPTKNLWVDDSQNPYKSLSESERYYDESYDFGFLEGEEDMDDILYYIGEDDVTFEQGENQVVITKEQFKTVMSAITTSQFNTNYK